MRAKHMRRAARGAWRKRALAYVISLALLCALLPSYVSASAAGEDGYLCGHVHDEGICGYTEASVGVPCDHVHGADCYTRQLQCAHVCDHVCSHVCGEECFVETPQCSHICGDECAEGCTHVCGEECYVSENVCAHVCDGECGGLCGHVHDDSCYVEVLDCRHEHGEDCSYEAPREGTPCLHICHITAFLADGGSQAWTADTPIATYDAEAGADYGTVCAALPETLPGTLECSDGTVDIPVRWSCDSYSSDAEVNVFRAEPANQYCDYIREDDPLTPDTDESALPYIEVTTVAAQPSSVPTAEPIPTPEPVCICDPMPGEGEAHTNPECPFYVAAQQSGTVPLLTERTLGPVTAEDGSTVSISGLLPENAYIDVKLVPLETAKELVGAESEKEILFAYDIKIMVPAEDEGGTATEYQPTALVTVSIAPPEDKPIQAPVEVTHIAQDESTGETTPQTVENVTTTESGAVEFAAEGFSVYIITITGGSTVTFDVADGYTVQYSTDNSAFTPLSGNVSVAVDSTLYFKISADTSPGVYLHGTYADPKPALSYSEGVYTLSGINANATIYVKESITFDLAQAPVVLGTDFSGKDSSGAAMSGPHISANKYTVSQSSPATATANTIRFAEAGTYDVTLSGINISGSGTNAVTGTTGSILVNAADTAMYVTLRLSGSNTIERLHYFCTGTGSLTITSAEGDGSESGTLNAAGSGWEAAIGGTDNNDATNNIFIEGGTIVADMTPSATAASKIALSGTASPSGTAWNMAATDGTAGSGGDYIALTLSGTVYKLTKALTAADETPAFNIVFTVEAGAHSA